MLKLWGLEHEKIVMLRTIQNESMCNFTQKCACVQTPTLLIARRAFCIIILYFQPCSSAIMSWDSLQNLHGNKTGAKL